MIRPKVLTPNKNKLCYFFFFIIFISLVSRISCVSQFDLHRHRFRIGNTSIDCNIKSVFCMCQYERFPYRPHCSSVFVCYCERNSSKTDANGKWHEKISNDSGKFGDSKHHSHSNQRTEKNQWKTKQNGKMMRRKGKHFNVKCWYTEWWRKKSGKIIMAIENNIKGF